MKYENNKIVYEVGDFVTRDKDRWANMEIGDTDKIDSAEDNGDYTNLLLSKFRNDGGHSSNNFRPATQEEINKATEEEKIMVGEYEVEFYKVEGSRPHTIKVGCVKVSEELFLKIGKKWGLL